ncbi:F510_1955 family glycosylhydrolase [Paenibacillus sp. 1P07SE]|uniref:F510_1955 family glycosylhydrolase n=1 Tax=Paenibacillus sp. 1P07SE TaxID=3132209 RepID=UPI0039A73818
MVQARNDFVIRKWTFFIVLITLFLAGCSTQGKENEPVILPHIHGIGYTSDGQQIYIPAHDGLKMFSQGTWDEVPGDKHDYMGFAMVDGGFYSSGHPSLDSDLKNPLGIVKSTDEGQTLEHLDLYGEIDFHLLSASYMSNSIYVFNPEPNVRLETIGLYYTQDEAENWMQSEMNGLTEEPIALAVHPSDDAIVAVGTEEALYVSSDYGNQFEKIADIPVTAISYSLDGQLYVGSYQEDEGVIFKMLSGNALEEELNIPDLIEEAPSYIAISPIDAKELVFTTFSRDVYLSKDQGATWMKIANQGQPLNHPSE